MSTTDRRTDPTAQNAIRARLTAFFAPLTRAEVEKLFDDHDGCVSPVLSYEETLESPQAAARGYVGRAEGLPIPALTFPAVVDGRRLPEHGPASRQGEHSEEIRGELTGAGGAWLGPARTPAGVARKAPLGERPPGVHLGTRPI